MSITVPIQYEFVVDRSYQRTMTTIMWRTFYRNPSRIAGIALWVAGTLCAFLLIDVPRHLIPLLIAITGTILYMQTVGLHRQAAHYVATTLPLNYTFGIGFSASAVAQRGRDGSSQTDFKQVLGISRVSGLIEVKYADKRLSYYPAHLIPQTVIDSVNRTILQFRPFT